MFSCSHFRLVNKSKTMLKWQQEEKSREEERVVAKSKPITSLVSKTANRSSTALGSRASNRLVTLGAQSSNSDHISMEKTRFERF